MSWIEVARTFEEVQALRQVWELLQSPFVTSDVEFVLTYVRKTTGDRPHAVVLRDDAARPRSSRAGDVASARLGQRRAGPGPRQMPWRFMGQVDETKRRALAAVGRRPGEVSVIRLRSGRLACAWSPPELPLPAASGLTGCALAGRIPTRRSAGSSLQSAAAMSHPPLLQAPQEKTYGDGRASNSDPDQIDRLFEDSALVHRETYRHVLGAA
jgi:hypothetical protein